MVKCGADIKENASRLKTAILFFCTFLNDFIYSFKMDIKVIKLTDKEYPRLLNETTSPPKVIFVRGKIFDLEKPTIAIVGTRKATSEGLRLAKQVAKTLAEKGFLIVSGLAMGIDTAAHEGALLAGGETIAVLGCGVDSIYPAQNENLGQKILASGGAIISEYPEGTPALPHRFLERNRIVAGLSLATIVIEAPAKSGALVTARFAAECGREVFVFPGFAGHPQYKGSHALIRDGARLVNSTEDVLEDLEPVLSLASPKTTRKFFDLERRKDLASVASDVFSGRAPLTERTRLPLGQSEGGAAVNAYAEHTNSARKNIAHDALTIFNLLLKSKTPPQVDKIIELTKLSPQVVNRELTDMLIKGIIDEDGFGYKIRTNK